MKIREFIGVTIYRLFAQYLPCSDSKIRLGQKKIRSISFRLMSGNTEGHINIDRKVRINKNVQIGYNSGIGEQSIFYGKVVIGENVLIGPRCRIVTKNHRYSSDSIPICKQGYFEEKPVIIKDNVWIGMDVIILPGVTIETGSIIAAGTLVHKSTRENYIYGGNPMKEIKNRLE